MSLDNVVANVAVKNLKAACDWYEKLLGRPASKILLDELAEWSFAGGGILHVLEVGEHAGMGSFTLVVKGLDDEASRLESLGMAITRRPGLGAMRTVVIEDPDGNCITLSDAFSPGSDISG